MVTNKVVIQVQIKSYKKNLVCKINKERKGSSRVQKQTYIFSYLHVYIVREDSFVERASVFILKMRGIITKRAYALIFLSKHYL